jgi:methylenetetrahydrofolate dehydrogenase (NADP+)/methenyltetrahydrofolate cyclohydrolase
MGKRSCSSAILFRIPKSMAEIIDGRQLAKKIYLGLHPKIQSYGQLASVPGLALVHVGEHPESQIYLRQKRKIAEDIGIHIRLEHLPGHASREKIIEAIDRLNVAPEIHGILVQLPLPDRSMEMAILDRIAPEKDVDGFGAFNLGKLCHGDPSGFWPCTPAGIHHLLQATGIPIEGQHVVLLGRSIIVGKPMGLILLQNNPGANATVTFCHSKTHNVADITRQADILIAAIGVPAFVKAPMVKPKAVVIDVGITRTPDAGEKSGYRLQGDVDFGSVSQVASFITPVPGGVGPMTVAMLMRNTLRAYEQQTKGL